MNYLGEQIDLIESTERVHISNLSLFENILPPDAFMALNLGNMPQRFGYWSEMHFSTLTQVRQIHLKEYDYCVLIEAFEQNIAIKIPDGEIWLLGNPQYDNSTDAIFIASSLLKFLKMLEFAKSLLWDNRSELYNNDMSFRDKATHNQLLAKFDEGIMRIDPKAFKNSVLYEEIIEFFHECEPWQEDEDF